MSNRRGLSDFATLFKKYRLKSEIETLSEFGDLLAEEGYIYENSLFTRWQSGQRIPKDRLLLLAVIKVFSRRGGVRNENEANAFLESLNQRDLTEREKLNFSNYFSSRKQLLPEQIELFIGRNQIIKDIIWQLINIRKVLLYGPPGVGKTAIAIKIAHLLKDRFSDGVFWFRSDLKTEDEIVDTLTGYLDPEHKTISSKETKIKKLNKLLQRKNILIILDNYEFRTSNNQIYSVLIDSNASILITSIKLFDNVVPSVINIPAFTYQEYYTFAEKVLGKPFVTANNKSVEEIGLLTGYMPISSSIILKQIFLNPLEIKKYITNIKIQNVALDSMTYDNKDLYKSIDICFNKLDKQLQKVLLSSALFEGSDFDIKAIAYIHDISLKFATELIRDLVEYSFLEPSIKERYRLHPLIRLYLKKQLSGTEKYVRLARYYSQLYKGEGEGDKVFFGKLPLDFDNIIGLIKTCDTLNLFTEITQLWRSIHIYIWVTGKWSIIFELDSIVQKSFRKTNDLRGLGYYLMDSLGRVHFFQNHVDKAFKCLRKSLEIVEKINDNFLLGLTYQKYGITYSRTGNFQEAEKFLKKAIDLLKNKPNDLEYIKSHIFLGDLYVKMKKFKEALVYLEIAYDKSKEENIDDTLSMSCIYMGELYLQTSNYQKAEEFFNQGLLIDKKLKREIGRVFAYDGLAKIAQIKGDVTKALRFFNIAIGLYKGLGIMEKVKEAKVNKLNMLKPHYK